MENYYWYNECPDCNQGRLIITHDITHDRLYLHCDECEMGWLNPMDVDQNKNGFLTLLVEFETLNPSFELIEAKQWAAVARHILQD